MEINRKEPTFKEIVITLNTQKEFDILIGILSFAPLDHALQKTDGNQFLGEMYNKLVKFKTPETKNNYHKYFTAISNYLG